MAQPLKGTEVQEALGIESVGRVKLRDTGPLLPAWVTGSVLGYDAADVERLRVRPIIGQPMPSLVERLGNLGTSEQERTLVSPRLQRISLSLLGTADFAATATGEGLTLVGVVLALPSG